MKQELEKFDAGKAELMQLADDYRNLVVTRDNLKEADKGRLVLKNARLGIQKQEKNNKEIIKQLTDWNKNEAASFVNLVEPIELRIARDIDIVNAEIEAEKRAAAKIIEDQKAEVQLLKDLSLKVSSSNDRKLIKDTLLNDVKPEMGDFSSEWDATFFALKAICTERLEFLQLKEEQEAKRAKEIEEAANKELAAAQAAPNMANHVGEIFEPKEVQPPLITNVGLPVGAGLFLPLCEPTHKIYHLGYEITISSNMSNELFEKCSAAIIEILNGEDII
jgi:hypothetical protein